MCCELHVGRADRKLASQPHGRHLLSFGMNNTSPPLSLLDSLADSLLLLSLSLPLLPLGTSSSRLASLIKLIKTTCVECVQEEEEEEEEEEGEGGGISLSDCRTIRPSVRRKKLFFPSRPPSKTGTTAVVFLTVAILWCWTHRERKGLVSSVGRKGILSSAVSP